MRKIMLITRRRGGFKNIVPNGLQVGDGAYDKFKY